MSTPTPIRDAFAPLLGKPCWQVEQGYSSFLTLEFGEPHLSVREPIQASAGASPRVRRSLARRDVTLRGDWHLWITYCEWVLWQGARYRATSRSSDARITDALLDLDGQQLTSVEVSPDLRHSCFRFDLGGRLETFAYKNEDNLIEQWMLFESTGDVLTIRSDGCYCRGPGETLPEQEQWICLPPSLPT